MGPYRLDNSLKQRKGGEVMRCRFPIIGSVFGPGGIFRQVFFHFLIKMKKKKMIAGKIRALVVAMLEGICIFFFCAMKKLFWRI